MRIRQFRISGAHGYLSLDVLLNSDLTFLTGINGSGKTTVVRGIAALLAPSIRDLSVIRYERMEVEISHGSETITVSAERFPDEVQLSCSAVTESLRVPIYKQADYEPSWRFEEKAADFYREQFTVHSTHPLLAFLTSLPTPMFLDLERRGVVPDESAKSLPPHRAPRRPYRWSLSESLVEAQVLADEVYRQYAARRQDLTEKLRKQLILTAFGSGIVGYPSFRSLPSLAEVERAAQDQALVIRTLVNLGIPSDDVKNTVATYFDGIREFASQLSQKSPSTELKIDDITPDQVELLGRWFALQPQHKQIRAIVGLVEEYNRDTVKAATRINGYLKAVNQFLSDSGKQLEFNRTGQLSVTKNRKELGDVSGLSSGERQLVVILTHLSFNPQVRKAKVLIIDEPELSLHVLWQERFVDAVLSAAPDIQFILATHSPSIILDKVENCVEVRPHEK